MQIGALIKRSGTRHGADSMGCWNCNGTIFSLPCTLSMSVVAINYRSGRIRTRVNRLITKQTCCKTASRARRHGGHRVMWIALILVLTVGLGPACPPGRGQDIVRLIGNGSSVPLPLYNKWKQEYNKRNAAVQFEYVALGTSE